MRACSSVRPSSRSSRDAYHHAAQPNKERQHESDHRYEQREPLFDTVGPRPVMSPATAAVRVVDELGFDPGDVPVERLQGHHLGHGRVDVPAHHWLLVGLVAAAAAAATSVVTAGVARRDQLQEPTDVQEVRQSLVRPSGCAVRSGAGVVAARGSLEARDWPSAVAISASRRPGAFEDFAPASSKAHAAG